MEKVIVCPVGDQPDALYPALREFTVQHVHMLTHKDYKKQADQLKADLEKFGIPFSEERMSDHVWEATFAGISEFVKGYERPDRIVVHVGVGDRNMQCAATTAAFVNGVHAVNGNSKFLMGLPVMRFSYYKLLSDKKMTVLEALEKGGKSLSDLAKDLHMSLSLLSYHVHGNRKSEGLSDMGLVELDERDGQVHIYLTAMGRLLLKGHVPQAEA